MAVSFCALAECNQIFEVEINANNSIYINKKLEFAAYFGSKVTLIYRQINLQAT